MNVDEFNYEWVDCKVFSRNKNYKGFGIVKFTLLLGSKQSLSCAVVYTVVYPVAG